MSAVTPPLSSAWLIVDDLPMFHRFAAGPGGRTETVVHVHGLAISGTYLEPTAARLAGRWRTYVPDLPGMGRSPAAADTSDVGGLARSLASYCTAAEIEHATFVGNSLGCSIVVELAHLFPQMVCGAVLVSPVGGPHNRPLLRLVGQAARDAWREPPSLLPIVVRDYVRCGVVHSWSMLRAMVRYPLAERLTATAMPTLVVVGRRDPLVSSSWAGALATSPHDRFIEVDGPHALNYSAPERIAGLTAAFIEHARIDHDGSFSRHDPVPPKGPQQCRSHAEPHDRAGDDVAG
ncbi:MAG: alpha/beta fold hydrolase [Ilumatobacteraceae bacterium]